MAQGGRFAPALVDFTQGENRAMHILSILFPPGNTSRRQWVLTFLAVFAIIIPSAYLGRDVITPAIAQAQAEERGLDTSSGPTGNWEYWSLYRRTQALCTGWCAAGGVVLGIGLCMSLEHLLEKRDRRMALPRNDLERWILGTYANFALYYGNVPERMEEKGPMKFLSHRANRDAVWTYNPNTPLYLGGRPRDEENQKMAAQDLKDSWNINGLQGLLDVVEYMSAGEGLAQCGDQAGRAWQLCRSAQLLGLAYLAGWLSREEMVSRSCLVGKTIQGTFRDWEEMNDSYMAGYERWARRNRLSQGMIQARQRIQRDLQSRKDSPYRLPWLLNLEPSYWVRRGKMERNLG